jgi:adenylate cyclase
MLPIVFSALSVIGLGILYVIMAKYQLEANDIWLPTMIPLLLETPLAFFGAVVWNYIDINKERQNIKKALGYHLPKEVVDQIAKDIVQIEMGTQVVYGICLFTDVEQYTTLSETMDPMELGRFMNRYYETMFRPVKQYGGYISGVIGDSMLAIWASTSSEAALRQKACSAAMGIKKELKLFGSSSEVPKIKTRIGLHCGQILLGHIGALDHYEYTPIGDIVNTASRIEGLNKHLGTAILVSDEVIHQLDGFLSREIGKFKVAGKVKPVWIHELLDFVKESDGRMRRACGIFTEALGAFRSQSWDQATDKFSQSIEEFGEDGPSRFYLEQCKNYKKNPPEQPWDGVIRMDKK